MFQGVVMKIKDVFNAVIGIFGLAVSLGAVVVALAMAAALVSYGWPKGDWALWWSAAGTIGTWLVGFAAAYIAIIQYRETDRKKNEEEQRKKKEAEIRAKDQTLAQLRVVHSSIENILDSATKRFLRRRRVHRQNWFRKFKKSLQTLCEVIDSLKQREGDLGIEGLEIRKLKKISTYYDFFKNQKKFSKNHCAMINELLSEIEGFFSDGQLVGISYDDIYPSSRLAAALCRYNIDSALSDIRCFYMLRS